MFPKYLKKAQKLARADLFAAPAFSFFKKILKDFPEAKIYLVGGGVRDLLLDRVVTDYDFVISKISRNNIERSLEKLGSLKFVGRRFGVYKFTPGGEKTAFDLALPRTEISTGHGTRDFEITTDPALPIEEDLKRRDFTINALALDVQNKKIIDPSTGLKDLGRKLIRTVGDPKKRFAEDYTRILRAVRQAVELNFKIDPRTLRFIKSEAPKIIKGEKEVVPLEMISEEFLKSLAADAFETIKLYDRAGLLKILLPEVVECKKITQSKSVHAEVYLFRHLMLLLKQLKSEDSVCLKLAALFHDLGKVPTREVKTVKGKRKITFYRHEEEGVKIFQKIAERFRFPRKLTYDVSFLIKRHLFLWHGDYRDMKISTLSKVFFENPDLGEDLLKLHFMDVSRKGAGRQKDLNYLKEAKEYLAHIKKRILSKNAKVVMPIDGRDVMRVLKLKEGRAVGKTLIRVREFYLSQAIKKKKVAREELLSYLRRLKP